MPRPMTEALEAALNVLSESDRRVLRKVARETVSPLLGGLLRALAAETYVLEIQEGEVLSQLFRDHQAELDELDARHPYPAPDPSMRFTLDPETGEFVRDEDPDTPPR